MGELERRATSLRGAIYNSLAGQAPAYSIAGGAAYIMQYAAAASPLAMLLTTLGVMAIVYSIFLLAKRYPHAASFYAYATNSLGSKVGFLNGVVYTLFYSATLGLGSVAIAFGYLAAQSVMALTGIAINPIYLVPIPMVLALVPAVLGIRPSIKTEVVLTSAEIAILVAFVGLSIYTNWGRLSLLPFTPQGTFAQGLLPVLAALSGGLLFSITYFMGFEVSTQIAEETSSPRRDVPVGTLLATLAMGLLYVAVTYSIVADLGYSQSAINNYVNQAQSGVNPIFGLIGSYLGPVVEALFAAAVIVSVYSCYLATLNATARMIYGMARDGLMPGAYAETNRFKAPAKALYLSTALAALTAIGAYLASYFSGYTEPISLTYNAMEYAYALDSLYYVASLVILAASAFKIAPVGGKIVAVLGAALLATTFYYSILAPIMLYLFSASIIAVLILEFTILKNKLSTIRETICRYC
ncbi:MAG: APC family permease [Thermoproteus sp.]